MSEDLDPMKYNLIEIDFNVQSILDSNYDKMNEIGKILSNMGLLPMIKEKGEVRTSGNFSLRVEGGFLITATNVCKSDLRKEDLIYVKDIDFENSQIRMVGKYRPSREVIIHQIAYSLFPSINVIIHTHDLMALNYGHAPTTNERVIDANLSESLRICNMLKKNDYINLKDHGQIIIGSHIEETILKIINHNIDSITNLKRIYLKNI